MSKKYNIVADENMPCIDELFGPLANVKKLSGRKITANDLKDADALLCRSITKVDKQLLEGSNVKFVGTATIGIDHLDVNWLENNAISWSSAAGCNAAAVAQYVISGICYWLETVNKKKLQDLTIGIVGAGNVGSVLARCLDILEVNYLLCDPPLKRSGDKRLLEPIENLMKCDVISFHLPITHTTQDKTYHIIDNAFLSQLTEQQLLINAARGEVVDNKALVEYLSKEKSASVILDVFENEPNIDTDLARKCLLATPHIAGHTLEGKLRGSYMVYEAFCKFYKLPLLVQADELFPRKNKINISTKTESEMLLFLYDISKDSEHFLSVIDEKIPQHFDLMRKSYINNFLVQPRRDYSGWQKNINLNKRIRMLLK